MNIRPARIAVVLALGALLTGCGPTKEEVHAHGGVEAYFASNFSDAERRLMPVADKTDENFVLNNCRLGSAALANYDLDEAEAAFLKAYEVINSVGVNQGGRSIGATLVAEKIKIWKGEPYERAMANFYLGLVYYIRHDYNNARAAFENALFKLRDYGESKDKNDEYRTVESNFALACIMLGRCYQRLGRDDLAKANFDRAAELHNWLSPLADPRIEGDSNVLIIADFGHGPKKYTSSDGSIVGLGPTPQEVGPVPPPQVIVDGKPYNLQGTNRPPVDLLALAQDRKWQSIDTIRAVKSAVGSGLIAAGAIDNAYNNSYDHHHHDNTGTDLALIGAGLLLKASSQADVRQWEMLPRTSFVLPLHLSPGKHDVTVQFPQPGMFETWRGIEAPEKGEATYYYRVQHRNNGPFVWPPPALAPQPVRPANPGPAPK
jgi:tetratricopeptide (TPR) repeat protein